MYGNFDGLDAMIISAQKAADAAQINILLDIVFGEAREQKSSYALRRGVPAVKGLSFVYRSEGQVLGTIRFWPAYIQDLETGELSQVLLLGPIAVSPMLQGQGVGGELIRKGLTAARFMGYNRVMLVGDNTYYKRFGFQSVMPSNITMPDGKDGDRLQYIDLCDNPDLPKAGTMVPYAPISSEK